MGAGAAIALNVLFGLLDRAQQIQQLIATAQAEGRDVTQAELDQFFAADDAAAAALKDAIAKARAASS